MAGGDGAGSGGGDGEGKGGSTEQVKGSLSQQNGGVAHQDASEGAAAAKDRELQGGDPTRRREVRSERNAYHRGIERV